MHVSEMRAVDENDARVRKELVAVDQAGKRSPTALRPAGKPAAVRVSARGDLTESELREILRYLDALSPPAKSR